MLEQHTLRVELQAVDWLIIAIYFAFVLGMGWALKKQMKSSADFLGGSHSIPTWICGLAFLSANLGALEVMGMAGNGYKYGLMTVHFYWLGAIPAMLFVGLFMMPFYYGSKARSVPEYLKLRFDEKTRALNAVSFAVLTVLMSGINLYAMALVFELMLGWPLHTAILSSAVVVLTYTYLGGLTSSIYNEVLQFFLIVFGFAPLAWASLQAVDGWHGLQQRFATTPSMLHLWSGVGQASSNPMGVEFFGLLMGLGFVLSFGYWCTDFLVIQRALASRDIRSAQRTPLLAAIFKMLFPILVVLPGLVAAAQNLPLPAHRFDATLPLMLKMFYPTGLLGLGLTALLASFMSGMAGNVTAFNTVCVYDIYQAYVRPDASDAQLLKMGRLITALGVLLSVAAAYLVMQFNSLMDYMQLLFSFFNAPMFATFLLGMFWARCTGHGAFSGLTVGISVGILHHVASVLGMLPNHSALAAAFDGAVWAWCSCLLVTVAVSLCTAPKAASELQGLVYSLTPQVVHSGSWYSRPAYLAIAVLSCVIALNCYFF